MPGVSGPVEDCRREPGAKIAMSELLTGLYCGAAPLGGLSIRRSLAGNEATGAAWQFGDSQANPNANPYAPTYMEPEAEMESGPLAPRQISVDEVISKSWLIFKKHWGMVCAVVAIMIGINIAMNMGQSLLVQVANARHQRAGRHVRDSVSCLALSLCACRFGCKLGQTMVMLDVARGRPINISKLFAGGPYLLMVSSRRSSSRLLSEPLRQCWWEFRLRQDSAATQIARGYGHRCCGWFCDRDRSACVCRVGYVTVLAVDRRREAQRH